MRPVDESQVGLALLTEVRADDMDSVGPSGFAAFGGAVWENTRVQAVLDEVPVHGGSSPDGPGLDQPPPSSRFKGAAVLQPRNQKKIGVAQQGIRERRLKGKDRKEALENDVRPLQELLEEKRADYLTARRAAVSRPELAVGKRIDCPAEAYRALATDFLVDAGAGSRETLDLLAAFGSDACVEKKSGAVEATPFEFIKGSGHQFFLDTVGELTERVTPEGVNHALFERWSYRDPKLSMRWDPAFGHIMAIAAVVKSGATESYLSQ